MEHMVSHPVAKGCRNWRYQSISFVLDGSEASMLPDDSEQPLAKCPMNVSYLNGQI
jgi:hypothetical protein